MLTEQKAKDRRILKTKQALSVGLLELLNKKPIEQITVKELTNHCNLNRSTFYLHYANVAALLEDMEQEILQGLNSVLDAFEQSGLPLTPETDSRAMVQAFWFLAQHKEFCTRIITQKKDRRFIGQVMEIVKRRCLGFWIQMPKSRQGEVGEYFFSFVLSGCLGVVEHWIESGMKQSPEEMAAMVSRFIGSGVNAILH